LGWISILTNCPWAKTDVVKKSKTIKITLKEIKLLKAKGKLDFIIISPQWD